MLPTHGPLDAGHIAHVRTNIAAYLQDRGIDLKQLAAQIGCSPKSLLKFTDDKHDETQDDFVRRVDKFLKQRMHDGGASLPAEIVQTGVTSRILGVIQQVVRLGSIGAIVGPSGIGKSTVFKAVAAGLVPSSVHIELSSVDASKSAFIARLARELGGPARYRMQASFNWLIDHLSQSRRLIILDEAHYLGEAAFNVMRDIHKRTGCPVVFGGTQDLLSTINDFTQFHGQFKRLVAITYNITEETHASGRPLYTVDEVTAFAQATGIRLTTNAAEIGTDLANLLGWGGFGALGFLLINANILALRESGRSTNVWVHDRHINSALRQMEGASGFDRVKQRTEQTQRKVAVA
jgi:DNA transposition AAA+ family ATPase